MIQDWWVFMLFGLNLPEVTNYCLNMSRTL